MLQLNFNWNFYYCSSKKPTFLQSFFVVVCLFICLSHRLICHQFGSFSIWFWRMKNALFRFRAVHVMIALIPKSNTFSMHFQNDTSLHYNANIINKILCSCSLTRSLSYSHHHNIFIIMCVYICTLFIIYSCLLWLDVVPKLARILCWMCLNKDLNIFCILIYLNLNHFMYDFFLDPNIYIVLC